MASCQNAPEEETENADQVLKLRNGNQSQQERNRKRKYAEVERADHQQDLKAHRKSSKKIQQNQNDRISCKMCGKSFATKKSLRTHKKTHLPAAFQCDVCGKKFTLKYHLIPHIKTHISPQNIPCKICNKLFKTIESIRTHRSKLHKKYGNGHSMHP